jgi:hypothetical protein
MARSRQEFYVKVNIHDSLTRERYERRGFWEFVRDKAKSPDVPNRSDSELENLLLTYFGIALNDELVLDFHYRGIALSKVFFKARNISHGSFRFSVDVAGFENLVNLFDNNYDLFFMAFSSLIPQAFSKVFKDYDIGGGSFNFDIDIPRDFKEEFGQPREKQDDNSSRQSESMKESLRPTRLQWAWVVSNTSLIVPVLLTLGVMYFLHNNLTFERTQAEARMQKMFDAQLSILDKERDRQDSLKEIEKRIITKYLEGIDQKSERTQAEASRKSLASIDQKSTKK